MRIPPPRSRAPPDGELARRLDRHRVVLCGRARRTGHHYQTASWSSISDPASVAPAGRIWSCTGDSRAPRYYRPEVAQGTCRHCSNAQVPAVAARSSRLAQPRAARRRVSGSDAPLLIIAGRRDRQDHDARAPDRAARARRRRPAAHPAAHVLAPRLAGDDPARAARVARGADLPWAGHVPRGRQPAAAPARARARPRSGVHRARSRRRRRPARSRARRSRASPRASGGSRARTRASRSTRARSTRAPRSRACSPRRTRGAASTPPRCARCSRAYVEEQARAPRARLRRPAAVVVARDGGARASRPRSARASITCWSTSTRTPTRCRPRSSSRCRRPAAASPRSATTRRRSTRSAPRPCTTSSTSRRRSPRRRALVPLEDNYRSTVPIVAASNAVIEQRAPSATPRRLRSSRPSQERPTLAIVDDEHGEVDYVIERVLALPRGRARSSAIRPCSCAPRTTPICSSSSSAAGASRT